MFLPEFNIELDEVNFSGNYMETPKLEYLGTLVNELEDKKDVQLALCLAAHLVPFRSSGIPKSLVNVVVKACNLLLDFADNYSDEQILTTYLISLAPVFDELGMRYRESIHAALLNTNPGDAIALMFKYFMIPTDDLDVQEELLSNLLHVRFSPKEMFNLVYSFSLLFEQPDCIVLAKWENFAVSQTEKYVYDTDLSEKIECWRRISVSYADRFERSGLMEEIKLAKMKSFRG